MASNKQNWTFPGLFQDGKKGVVGNFKLIDSTTSPPSKTYILEVWRGGGVAFSFHNTEKFVDGAGFRLQHIRK